MQEIENLKYKLERARKEEKLKYIQDQFQAQGQMILKNGFEFELVEIPKVKIVEVAPPHSDIFTNNGFKLFEYLLKILFLKAEAEKILLPIITDECLKTIL